jgi:hypothetical protein
MPAQRKQFDNLKRILATVKRLRQSLREDLFGQQAPAGRARVLPDAVLRGQFHLPLPAPPLDVEQPFAIDQSSLLRLGRVEQFCGQWPEQPIPNPGVPRHDSQRLPILRQRPLTQHLAGDDEIRTACLRFGCLTIAMKSASIGRVASSIPNCSAVFSALLLPVFGRGQYAPAKLTPMTVMSCSRITFAARVESSPPESNATAIAFGLSVTRRE